MIANFHNKGSLAAFVILSMAGHLLGGYAVGWFGHFDLRAPVSLLPAMSVSLEGVAAPPASPTVPEEHPANVSKPVSVQSAAGEEAKGDGSGETAAGDDDSFSDEEKVVGPGPVVQSTSSPREPGIADSREGATAKAPPETKVVVNAGHVAVPVLTPVNPQKEPVLKGDEFVAPGLEKLTYRIVMFGIPAGTAVMEARNSNGEFRITTKVTSNNTISSIYPVDDFIDTRLIVGNYLLTRIRQHEGSLVSDTGFTLMLRERNAFWVDRLHNRYDNRPLPRDDVMDVITGLYFLRNQRLEVGKPVLLHLFDSSEYVPTTVEVLRRERLRLPGFREADTLVVHPVLKTAGFFRRAGDMTVWLTDDDKKVPVRFEMRIPLGRVTAELVSAETERTAEVAARDTARK
jgi:hypothetical protein